MNDKPLRTPKKTPRKKSRKRSETTSDKPQSPSFEESLSALEASVQQLESGELSLSESLKCYEEGIRWLRQCYGKLEQAEQQVAMLTNVNEEGEFQAVRFAEAEMSLEEKANSRSARRSTTGDAEEPAPREREDGSDGVDGSRGLF